MRRWALKLSSLGDKLKVRKDIQDPKEIERQVESWFKHQLKVTLWQHLDDNKRHQHQATIYLNKTEQREFTILGFADQWDINQPFYIYVEDRRFVFRTYYVDNLPGRLIFSYPQHMMLLMEDDEFVIKSNNNLGKDYLKVKSLSSINSQSLLKDVGFLSLEDEDRYYADKRSSPRSKPSIRKKVLLAFENGSSVEETLYDLSTGGLGVITSFPENYPVGGLVHILAFDKTPLDGLFKGKVVSLREVDKQGSEFKIGIQFLQL